MTYIVHMAGGSEIEINESQFKKLTIDIEFYKMKTFIVYGSTGSIDGTIFVQHISLIKVKQ